MTCRHADTELVTNTVTGKPLAEVCTWCYAQLPLGWSCPACERTEVISWGSGSVRTVFTVRCAEHRDGTGAPA